MNWKRKVPKWEPSDGFRVSFVFSTDDSSITGHMGKLSVLELCAGAGGQALGFEEAGYSHVGLVELDSHACKTLRYNRPDWDVREEDLNHFCAKQFSGVDVVAAGLPCPWLHD